jgi:predicted DNA-binding transcriptional regulator YafY
MNRIDRLSAILIMLQTKRIIKAAEIAERFGLSLRTVYRDIRALEEAGIPIGSEAGIGYFLVKGYHLPPVVFSRQEAAALVLSQKLVASFTDKSIQSGYNQALDKVRSVLKSNDKDLLENLDEQVKVMRFVPSPTCQQNPGYLTLIQDALAERKVVRIDYFNQYRNQTTCREIEPLGLVFYSGSWHLIGFCRLRQDYRDFRIDKIQNLELPGEQFMLSSRKSLEEYLEMLRQSYPLTKTTVTFTKKVAHYIAVQKYYQGFVGEESMEDQVKMEFLTFDLNSFARWLITFSDAVKVHEPSALKQKMQEIAAEIRNHWLK